MSDGRGLRILRGTAAASVATAVALIGHLLGGAESVPLLGILLPWWLSVSVCVLAIGRRPSLVGMSVSVAASQVLFHLLFSIGGGVQLALAAGGLSSGHHAGHGAAASRAAVNGAVPPGAMPDGVMPDGAMVHGGMTMPATAATPDSSAAAHLAHAVGMGPMMLLGHVAAALVTISLLHRGEVVLLRCLGLIARALAHIAPHLPRPLLALPAAPAARDRAPQQIGARLREALLDPQRRRGPPLLLAV
ncbi:hypothetical protein [Brachybacterium nesterenkovii]|uniref:hypothetical protein n=1 Tax=Brachybacterium nesterenkovii TaxID=47847 RepID=UPI00321BF05B